MSIPILRDSTVASLRDAIRDNLERYRERDFSFLTLDPSLRLELPIAANDAALVQLKMPSGDQLYEVENCMAVHQYLQGLSPYDARDERLWCYLTHTVFLEYVRARWPIPADDEKAVSYIETHFFARTNRQVERDNAVSRLWWMTHLCTRVDGVSQRVALEAFLYRADVRANIIERPTVAQSSSVFSVILKALVASMSGQKALFERSTFREVMIELNSIGGFRLLDVLPEAEVSTIFRDVVANRIGLSSL